MSKIVRPVLITIEEAAKIAKVSSRTIYRWVEEFTWQGVILTLDGDYIYFDAPIIKHKRWIEYDTFINAVLETKYGLKK